MKGEVLIGSGIILILIGFLLVFVGSFILAAGGEGNVEGGGVIMIGPIPIVFGTGRGATVAAVLALILMVLWIIGSLLLRRG